MVIMTGNFNIRNSSWDPYFHNYSIHTEDLTTIADSLGLELFFFSNPGLTRFADNIWDSNLVLDLVFLFSSNSGFGQHSLYPEIWKPSDHVSLIIKVGIKKVNVNIAI